MNSFTPHKNAGLTIVVTTLTVLLFTGCGGSSNPSSSSSGSSSEATTQAPVTVQAGSLTKAQFIKRADLICEKGRHQFEAKLKAFLQSRGNSELSALSSLKRPEAEALVNETFIPIHEKETDQVSSLGAPSGDKEVVTAIFETIQKGLGEARQQPLRFTQTSITSFPAFAKATKLATAYGMSQCGQS